MPGIRRTARDRAREQLTAEILEEARRQLVEGGAEQLSLRAVARELGMVSSALYRYFPSRDDLLTALIVEAYDTVGERVEHAIEGRRRGDFLGRWRAGARAVRAWAVEHPREYALIYGSPIVGYRAPRDTVVPAARVPMAMLGVVRECHEAGRLDPPPGQPAPSKAALGQLDRLVRVAELGDLPRAAAASAVAAWAQLLGMTSLELFGHLEGVVDEPRSLAAHTVDQLAWLIGLPAH